MKLSEKLARLKARRGMTTDALSLKSGIPKGTINKVLNGETRNPTISTLKALAEALECPLEWLSDNGGSAAVPPPQPAESQTRQQQTYAHNLLKLQNGLVHSKQK